MQSIKKIKHSITPTVLLFSLPFFAYATDTPTTFAGLVNLIIGIIGLIVPLILGIVFIVIIWKVIDAWVIHGGDAAKREEGKQLVLIGVIVFVLMFVTWGIVALLNNTFFG